jgi:hypothetical protein
VREGQRDSLLEKDGCCKLFKQVMVGFLHMQVCLPTSFLPSTRGQKRGLATVQFDQGYVIVLGRSWWWFGEVSNNFELDRDRYGGNFMHDAILGLLASLICTKQCMHRWIRWV